MRRRRSLTLAAGALLAAVTVYAAGNTDGVPVSVLVTVEGKGGNVPAVTASDVRVQQDKHDRSVKSFTRLGNSKSQLLLLIDDSAGGSFDTNIQDIKQFITALPPTYEVGVGYMHNGTVEMTSQFTADHTKAASSVRLPLGIGGADVSPYDSLADAAKKWPMEEGVDRREVVMISSGVEALGGGFPPENPYVNAGIAAAQKAGLTVYAIFNPLAGHAGHSFWRASWGQNFLSQLADETGGELYLEGFRSSVSYQPFFSDILKRQADQYVLTFEAEGQNKAGLQPVKISSTSRNASIAAPDKVWVKANL